MDMNRKQFLGSLFAGITVGCNPAFATEQSEVDKCKNDILYWVDNYLKVHDSLYGDLKMSPQQREYLKRMSETKDILVCAKGRQIGASTANLVFAHWKTRFFENQHVFIVEPNLRCANLFQKIDCNSIFHTPAPCQDGSMVHITTPKRIERGIDWRDRNNTFVFDEYDWWELESQKATLLEIVCRMNYSRMLEKNESMEHQLEYAPIIIPSTPRHVMEHFVFPNLHFFLHNSRYMVLPSPTRGLKA